MLSGWERLLESSMFIEIGVMCLVQVVFRSVFEPVKGYLCFVLVICIGFCLSRSG